MAFELQHTSIKAFLVPNHASVSIKLKDSLEPLKDWTYRGFDDDREFILFSKGDRLRWIPISSILYIEQTSTESET